MIKAVVFDLDDTLYDYTTLNWGAMAALEQYVCSRYGVTCEQFGQAFLAARKEIKQALGNTAASHNRMLYSQKTLERLGVNPTDSALEMYEEYWGYILSHMVLRPGAEGLLMYCKECGIKVGICSDLTAYIQHRKLRALGIAQHIDALVTSEEAGVEKPDARMFDLILSKLQTRPEETLFVGDSLEKDIFGAEQAGMTALWLGGNDRPNAIASLFEVRSMLV